MGLLEIYRDDLYLHTDSEMCLDNFTWGGCSEKKLPTVFLTNYFYIANLFNSTKYKEITQETIYNQIYY